MPPAPQSWFDQQPPPPGRTTQPVTPPGGNPVGPDIPVGPSQNPMDDAYIAQQIAAYAAQHRTDPGFDQSLINDPGYWVGKIKETGGWQGGNATYWTDKFATAQHQAPGTGVGSGGTVGGFGGVAGVAGPNMGGNAPGNINLNAGVQGTGLAGGFGLNFQAPTAEQAAATPGYQFALQQGIKGVDMGAAARGNVLGGGTKKAEIGYATGLADQTYGQSYERAMQEYLNAYNIFRGNQQDVFNRYATVGNWGTANPAA